MALSCSWDVQVGCKEQFSLRGSGEAVAQVAWEGGGVTVPGGVQELWGCGSEGHGQCHGGSGLGLDLVILEAFSDLNDSMIQQRAEGIQRSLKLGDPNACDARRAGDVSS